MPRKPKGDKDGGRNQAKKRKVEQSTPALPAATDPQSAVDLVPTSAAVDKEANMS